jgi:hypothetical protein
MWRKSLAFQNICNSTEESANIQNARIWENKMVGQTPEVSKMADQIDCSSAGRAAWFLAFSSRTSKCRQLLATDIQTQAVVDGLQLVNGTRVPSSPGFFLGTEPNLKTFQLSLSEFCRS